MLVRACHKKYNVLTKTRVEDVIYVTREGRSRSEIFRDRGRIKSRHFDFLLCDNQAQPIAAIELDDSSHNTAKARETDRFKDELCASVGLEMIRFKVADRYDVDEICQRLP